MKVGVHPEKLNDCISNDHLLEIALFLTSWQIVTQHLGLSEIDVNDIERETLGKKEQEKRLRALQKWRSKFSFKATYKRLLEVLLSLAEADVAEKVCHLLKGICLIHPINNFFRMGGVLKSRRRVLLYTDNCILVINIIMLLKIHVG